MPERLRASASPREGRHSTTDPGGRRDWSHSGTWRAGGIRDICARRTVQRLNPPRKLEGKGGQRTGGGEEQGRLWPHDDFIPESTPRGEKTVLTPVPQT